MTLATALVSGNEPVPQLAEQAVHQALAKAGLTHANGVLLFLTPEFARHAQAAVTAAARAAQSMQIAGGIAAGVFTETGWVLDRPAAAVMVFGGGLSIGHPEINPGPILNYTGGSLQNNWPEQASHSGPQFGGSYAGSAAQGGTAAWQQSRLVESQTCKVQILGAQLDIGVSSGLELLSEAQTVELSNGFDLERIGGQTALRSLYRRLPADLREHLESNAQNRQQDLPQSLHQSLHQLAAVLIGNEPGSARQALSAGDYRPIAVIAINHDQSLTLADRIAPGQRLAWAIRRPAAAEIDMRQTVAQLREAAPHPAGALMFSCIGRGPFFYTGDDRDLIALRDRCPGLPVLGTYGTGQIAPPGAAGSAPGRLWQNTVVTALITPNEKKAHV